MAVFGYGPDEARVQRAVDALAQARCTMRSPSSRWTCRTRRRGRARDAQRGEPGAPVVLADTQDNPGAGGNGDTTGLLAALFEREPRDAVLGLLIDPRLRAVRRTQSGVGRTAEFRLGETSGVPGHVPLAGEFTVVALADGKFTCTGPMFKGFKMELGPMAVLRQGNVRVVLASKKVQAADQEMFRHVGIEPVQQRILALKSSVHFRADFEPIASEVLVVVAPGPGEGGSDDVPRGRDCATGLRLKPMAARVPFSPPSRRIASGPMQRRFVIGAHQARDEHVLAAGRRRWPRSATARPGVRRRRARTLRGHQHADGGVSRHRAAR